MRKVIAIILSMVLCLSTVPASVFAEGEDGGEKSVQETSAAVSPAFQEKLFTELNASDKLTLSGGLEGAKLTEKAGTAGLFIEAETEKYNTGRIVIADEYDFDEKPAGRRTDVRPVGRISIDGISAKKAKAYVNIYLDDEEEPCASMLLKREMGKISWGREGSLTADVLDKNITGKHRVSIGFSVESTSKKPKILLRSITFCENSVPVMYFDLDESEGSIDAMNGSDDHSAECYGKVTLQIPDGYKGEFSDKPLKTMKDLELDYIRGRGNSTWYQDKKPYKVKLDKKQNLLGMGANKHWVLLANRYDNSLLRNRVTYWIVRYLGIEYAIKCAPVEVVMNGRYFGSYLLSEQVRVDENRIEVDELDESVSEPDSLEITGGYLLNLSGDEEDSLSAFATKRGGMYGIESPDFSDYDPEKGAEKAIKAQHQYIADYTQGVEDAIFGNDLTDDQGRRYSDLLDEDSAVNYWWIQEFSINGDAFGGGSNYLYKKRDTLTEDGKTVPGKLYWGPLWDFDYVAWGNPNSDPDRYDGFSNTSDNWMTKLRSDEEFCSRLRARWSEPAGSADNLYDSHLSDAMSEVLKEGGVIDQYYDEVRVSEYYDYSRWGFFNEYSDYSDYAGTGMTPVIAGEQQPDQDPDGEQQEEQQKKAVQTYESEVEQLRNWIKLRTSWVAENIADVGVQTYTVRFLIDGKVIATRSYSEYEEFGTLPEAPERDGYTFKGWYDPDGYRIDEESSTGVDMDVFGKYVKTSKLKKAKDIFFETYDAFTWFYDYSGDDDDDFYPSYELMPENSAPEKITWSVDDPEVATVNEDGAVAPKKAGTVTVTATLSSGKKKSYRVTFVSEMEDMYEVDSITLNKSKLKMKTGAYRQLIADLDPKPHYSSYINWFTMDSDIATVDEYGIVRAKKPGSTMIVALETDSRQFDVCRLTVTATKAYKIKTAKAAIVTSVKAKAVKAGKKRSVKVSWKKASGVSGYYVLRSSSKNGKFRKAGAVKKAKTVSWTDRKVSAGKTYYYKVQPFTKIGRKTYKGKLSAAATTIVK